MPITQKFDWKTLQEEPEEIDEHTPLFQSQHEEEELSLSQQDLISKVPLWNKGWIWFKNKFSKFRMGN